MRKNLPSNGSFDAHRAKFNRDTDAYVTVRLETIKPGATVSAAPTFPDNSIAKSLYTVRYRTPVVSQQSASISIARDFEPGVPGTLLHQIVMGLSIGTRSLIERMGVLCVDMTDFGRSSSPIAKELM